MSMVHCQRAVLLQFLLVIYLAALLKCSCRWHWLTNQTVKPIQNMKGNTVSKYSFAICFWTMSCPNQHDEIDSCFFLFFFFFGVCVCAWRSTSPGFYFFIFVSSSPKVLNQEQNAAVVDREAHSSLLLSAQQINILLQAPLPSHSEKCLSSKLVAEVGSICVSLLHELYCECYVSLRHLLLSVL